MKKIFSILLVFIIIFSFIGCTNTSFDDKLLYTSKSSMKGFVPSEDTLSIDAYSNKYVVNVEHGIQQISSTYFIDSTDENTDKFAWTNIKEITSSDILGTVTESKKLITNYINESYILKDKETLISYINNLPFKSADFPDESLIAGFDPKLDTVFLNIQSNLVDTHTIVHELFHALASKTRSNNSKWYEYTTTIFDEAFTEMLASSVIKPKYPTTYSNYIRYIYHFIGIFGLDAIGSYFYGLDELQISLTEFHLYTMAVECLDTCNGFEEIEGEKAILHLILSTWIKNK